jgi:general stress protein 26
LNFVSFFPENVDNYPLIISENSVFHFADMTKDILYEFISRHKLAVVSSLSPDNFPQSALVGIAVAPDLRIIFDTLTDSRKYHNLIQNPAVSVVIGWEKEATIQIEGFASIPEGDDLEELKNIYYQAYPHGWQRGSMWPDITYFCIQPTWIRFSDYNTDPPRIFEMKIGTDKEDGQVTLF